MERRSVTWNPRILPIVPTHSPPKLPRTTRGEGVDPVRTTLRDPSRHGLRAARRPRPLAPRSEYGTAQATIFNNPSHEAAPLAAHAVALCRSSEQPTTLTLAYSLGEVLPPSPSPQKLHTRIAKSEGISVYGFVARPSPGRTSSYRGRSVCRTASACNRTAANATPDGTTFHYAAFILCRIRTPGVGDRVAHALRTLLARARSARPRRRSGRRFLVDNHSVRA